MIAGGCRCGACRYTLALDRLPAVYACHCHQCQRWSGSAFGLQALVPETGLVAEGPIVSFDLRTDDRISSQRVCEACHTRLYNTNSRRPGVAVVRAGTLDRSEELECRAHIFTATRQRWISIPADVAQWLEFPPLDEFVRLLA